MYRINQIDGLKVLKKKIKQKNFGVSIFTLSAMTKMDNWTVKSGYTMANSGCTVFVFDYEKGLKDIKFFYV